MRPRFRQFHLRFDRKCLRYVQKQAGRAKWRARLSMLTFTYLSVISAWNSCRLLTGRDFFEHIEWIATTDALAAAIVVI